MKTTRDCSAVYLVYYLHYTLHNTPSVSTVLHGVPIFLHFSVFEKHSTVLFKKFGVVFFLHPQKIGGKILHCVYFGVCFKKIKKDQKVEKCCKK
jgi:hypothetical protein